jgi:L-lactate dehydrogenase complex protein LldE
LLEEPVCCGQPLINMGAAHDASCLVRRFAEVAKRFDAIVCPSGSCVASLRHSQAGTELGSRVFELSEYLLRVGAQISSAPFPRRVMLHASCHGLRELGLGASSEQPTRRCRDTVVSLLSNVPNLTLLRGTRDECCGFGGTFAVTEAPLSVRMGEDRLREYVSLGAEVITGTDSSCLMHLEGVASSQGLPLSFMHFAEILMHEGVNA